MLNELPYNFQILVLPYTMKRYKCYYVSVFFILSRNSEPVTSKSKFIQSTCLGVYLCILQIYIVRLYVQ